MHYSDTTLRLNNHMVRVSWSNDCWLVEEQGASGQWIVDCTTSKITLREVSFNGRVATGIARRYSGSMLNKPFEEGEIWADWADFLPNGEIKISW